MCRCSKTGPYPYPVKRRVGSDTGHLSNVQAADELEVLLSDALAARWVAMHISQNNTRTVCRRGAEPPWFDAPGIRQRCRSRIRPCW